MTDAPPTTTPTWPLPDLPGTPEEVWSAPYPDFIAMVNQTNVPPGAHTTLNTWALHSRLGPESTLLDVACTTGFTSRELARLTGCAAVGFDLSKDAVALACYNHHTTAPELDLSYVQADGRTFDPGRRFTHIAVGAALGFFPDPAAMAARLLHHLHDGGHILAAPFWSDADLPEQIADLRRDVFGITSPLEARHQALTLFHGLDVLHQQDHHITPETDEDIDHYCASTITRACAQAGVDDSAVREAMLDRLRQIKHATNRLRKYLRYSVLVLRYNAADHPARYVELF